MRSSALSADSVAYRSMLVDVLSPGHVVTQEPGVATAVGLSDRVRHLISCFVPAHPSLVLPWKCWGREQVEVSSGAGNLKARRLMLVDPSETCVVKRQVGRGAARSLALGEKVSSPRVQSCRWSFPTEGSPSVSTVFCHY